MVNRKHYKRKMTVLFLLIVAGLFCVYAFASYTKRREKHEETGRVTPAATHAVNSPTEAEKPTAQINPTTEVEYQKVGLEVHFLNVGEGSATLLLCGENAVLIDGGNASASSYVVSYLGKCGVERLSLIVATHYDSDHLNGIVGALAVYGSEEVWGPDYVADTRAYRSFVTHTEEMGLSVLHPTMGKRWSRDGLELRVISVGEPGDEENDQSIALMVEYEGTKILIAGDATEVRERRMVSAGADVDCDIYYVSHHGSMYSSSEVFLDAMTPEAAIISVGKNSYGHPHAVCIERLNERGISLYRTDMQGEIVLTVTAEGRKFSTTPVDILPTME